MTLDGSVLALMAGGAEQVERNEARAREAGALLGAFGFEPQGLDVAFLHCPAAELGGLVAQHARLHDLTLVPLPTGPGLQQEIAESVAFASGGPVLVAPHVATVKPPALDRIVVAWDFGAPAARALASALPILRTAGEVRVVVVENEKPIRSPASFDLLLRRLRAHGIEPLLDREDAAGRRIGPALVDYVHGRKADLLVMGAYGHARFREFMLGGATRSLLETAPVPVLLAH